jgi:hypothetical protein
MAPKNQPMTFRTVEVEFRGTESVPRVSVSYGPRFRWTISSRWAVNEKTTRQQRCGQKKRLRRPLSSIPQWFRSSPLLSRHVAIAQIRPTWTRLQIFFSQCCEAIHFRPASRSLVIIKTRGIPAKDCRLDFAVSRAKRFESEPLLHIFGYFEPPQSFDLPLR